MKRSFEWDDIALFAAVARAGGLSGAATTTGVSAPTLSRRMTALERDLGRRLFVRGARGYALTDDGRRLLARADVMGQAAHEINRWATQDARQSRVRISAGAWTSRWLSRNLSAFWQPSAAWIPEFLAAHEFVDISRRAADIGIRNQRPDQPWLAGQKASTVHYAAYARDADVTRWIGLAGETANTATARWVRETHGTHIVTKVNDPRIGLELMKAGIGRMVLPMFIGEAEPGISRVSDKIAALTKEEWLVSHHEARHDPPVHAALQALVKLLRAPRIP